MELTVNRVQFQDLADPQATCFWNGRQVHVYGFLHQMPEGKWILSSRALLRSCCAMHSVQQKDSILLAKEPMMQESVQTGELTLLEGTLLAQEGNVWTLQEPRVIHETLQLNLCSITALLCMGTCALLLLYFLSKPLLRRLS